MITFVFSDISSSEPDPWQGFQLEDVNIIQEQIDAEDVALIEKMKSAARAARDLSDVATSESQQLLQLFGIPYLVSPTGKLSFKSNLGNFNYMF